MYQRHLESLRRKLTSRIALLGQLAGSGWGTGATTLRTATLVHLTTEYCAPAWCRSAHTRLIDPTINNALRIVTGCLRPTPADNLPILVGMQHAELPRSGATLSLGRRAMEPGLFHDYWDQFIWDHSFETTFIWDHNIWDHVHLRPTDLRPLHLRPRSFGTCSFEATFIWDFFIVDHIHLRPHSFETIFILDQIHLRPHSFETTVICDHIL